MLVCPGNADRNWRVDGLRQKHETIHSSNGINMTLRGGNQVLARNPSITGAKFEDTTLLSENVPEVLTRSSNWPELEVELPVGRLFRPSIRIR